MSRRGRLSFNDRQGTRRGSFAARASSTYRDQAAALSDERDDPFWIDHRIDLSQFTRISWKDLDAALRDRREVFRNRIVLAGADYAGSGDEPRVPGQDAVPGVTLHGATLQTILEDFPIRGVGTVGLILLAGVGSALLCGIALLVRPAFVVVVGAATVIGGVVASGALLAWGGLVVPLVVPVGLWLAACAVGYAVARTRAPYPVHERPGLADRPLRGGPSTS